MVAASKLTPSASKVVVGESAGSLAGGGGKVRELAEVWSKSGAMAMQPNLFYFHMMWPVSPALGILIVAAPRMSCFPDNISPPISPW